MGMLNLGRRAISVAAIAVLCLLAAPLANASDWTYWRGPSFNGVSDETGLVDNWTPGGENTAWHAPLISRSTPILVDGRVCVNGRVGLDVERQEYVACFDAKSGKKLWEDRFNVYNTTVPFNRVGWASLAADPVTGDIIAHGVAGQLRSYAPDGTIKWSRFLAEEVGRLSGYGGRTQTPVVDGDQIYLSFVSSNWGPTAAFRHRMYAFDKNTGKLNWVATPGGLPKDANTQSAVVLATIKGQDVLLFGNSDGAIYALQRQTGETIWKFQLSKRGINTTVLYHDNVVYASHSEENIDTPVMGRVVAIDATGTGDVTKTHELWRIEELAAGFPSPAYKDGRLYYIDNSANLHSINAETGEKMWDFNVGTVGKASPVIADGKIYVTETNGWVRILKLNDDKTITQLDEDQLRMAEEDRYAELYGSPAIAYGRVYIAAESGLYCLAKKGAPFEVPKRPKPSKPKMGKGEIATLRVSPTEIEVSPGSKIDYVVRAYNAKGEYLGEQKADLSLKGVKGKLSGNKLTVAKDHGVAGGTVTATVGGVSADATIRVHPPLPWMIDFESTEVGKSPITMVGAPGKYMVEEKDGNKVLTKVVRDRGLLRTMTYFGPSNWTNYQIQADVMGNFKKRRKADIGLIAGGYTLDLQGNKQRLQLRSWPSEERMAVDVEFPWEFQVWYVAKLQVEQKDGKAHVRGKVWKKGEPEPEAWSIEVVDPLPIAGGAPGLVGYSPAPIHWDNIQVTEIK